jgi:xanthine dehydrogenase accessory factor
MRRELLDQLLEARAERRAVAVVTDLATGAQRLVARDEAVEDSLADALTDGFRFDKSGVVSTPSGECFIQIHNPALDLVMVGAVHIAQALIPIARLAGYRVTVIDPRGAFATPERFEGVELMAEWPDEALARRRLDERSALLALTHDPKIDDPALSIALSSPCFYIGALGSRRTHATRLERLRAKGFDEAALARIHAPIGLEIGARGAPEIAISIMAEVTQALRLGDKEAHR